MTRLAYGAPDGHGRYGILDRDDDGRLICHECGQAREHLATHLRQAHGVGAVEYRAAHGLSTGTRLIGASTLARLSEVWHEHEAEHRARLDATRDPERARAANTREGRWRPERIARRIEASASRRTELTPEQVAELGDVTDMQGWADRVRALVTRDGVSLAAVGRAFGLAAPSVSGRLRRYPARP